MLDTVRLFDVRLTVVRLKLQVLNLCGDIYAKCKWMGKILPESKSVLEPLKQTHFKTRTQKQLALAFKSEGLLAVTLLESNPEAKLRLARKEVASLAGKTRGVSSDDVHPALLQAVKDLLPTS